MLHGLWSPGAGLLLWYPPGGAGASGSDVPGLLGSVVRNARFRHRADVLVADADGIRRERVRAHALAPDAAVAALRQRLPVEAVSGDLRFLSHVALGVQRWVQAGRVVPELRRDDGQWWARWRLVGGAGQRAWLAELAAAMPAALQVAGAAPAVLEDMVTELTDPIARELVDDPSCEHPLVHGLYADVAVDSGSHQVAETLERWRNSLASDEPELVLRLLEPDGEFDADTDAALWRLEVCLRVDGAAPAPVPLHGDPHLVRAAVERLGAAQRAYPRLRDLPGDPRSMDLFLPTEVVADLVAHGAHALRSAGIRLLLPRAWNIVAPTLRLRVDGTVPAAESTVGLDGLVSYRWELALGDTVLTPAEMQRLVRAESDLVRLRNEWVQADHTTLAAAAEYVALHTGGGEITMADLLGEIAATRVDQVPITAVTATGWAAELLGHAHEPELVPPPAGLRASLRPYQLRGLSWLATMSRMGCGAILADDMGLGKTIQVLALLLHERRHRADEKTAVGPTMLVCPMSVVGNWQREAQRFAPDLRVLVHHGADRGRGTQLAAAVAGSDLVVTTYALLARDIGELTQQQWARVVLDEAQHIKNAATKAARAARAVPARHRLALTGTPVENRLEELRALLDFVMPKLLGSAQTFRARFAVPIEREHDQNAITRLRTVTAPFVLRRVKTDPAVISDLPEKLEMTVRANLTVEQAALYQAVVDDMLEKLRDAKGMARKGAVLGALTRLKQVCNHPAHYLGDGSAVLRRGGHRSGKLALVDDVLDAVLAEGEKALLFTQFREFGELIAPYLSERFGTRVPFLHGGLSKKRRDTMVEGFGEQHGPPLMLLSLKAGGTGLNLTAANHVVHMDRWWNPAVENQATDRAFRIGQQRSVQVRKLVCVDTIEERIDDMINGKSMLADLAVGAGENWITELSTDELRELFTLGAEAVGE
ncbi:DEAD/DEAH box helicase [Nocardia donostiensis]|uniref:ATP-dependent helicase n=1 Tax=Nocardia donostiensis TaxID=1538463 RepID=A0A1W0B538_9NOCA|nr:DEAD/DEAH box helicase [Nocardia donostiensis]ONM46981.1 ATP-dependent helicase [Nocardia donostiensis]OQS17653.1 ATP-dependent helicase [Nocardia donostiensis]